jgi:hypothetical protein
MNKERLLELHYMLVHHHELFPSIKFDMDGWCHAENCGTAACAFGSACLHKPFRKQGLRFDGINIPVYEGRSGYDAAARFFDIEWEASEYLFSPDSYELGIQITPIMVADRVLKLVQEVK